MRGGVGAPAVRYHAARVAASLICLGPPREERLPVIDLSACSPVLQAPWLGGRSEVEATKEEREVEEPEEVVVVEGARPSRDSRDHAGETR